MDYYKVLGVPESSNQDDIKKAYRKLSLKHHPDRGGDEEQFKKINEAYSILGDVEKRRMYKMQNANPFAQMHRGSPVDIDPIFKMFFGGGFPGMPGMAGGGGGMPGMPHVQIFRNGQPVNMQSLQKPAPIIKNVVISLEQSYNGMTYPLQIERWILINNVKRIEKEKLYVNINKGVDSGEIMIVKEKGNIINDRLKGDIKLHIKVENNTNMKRDGLNLVYNKDITLKESLTGFKFDIKHINGKTYTINNEGGNIIPSNYIKEISNLGMSRQNNIGKLIIKFNVIFPETLSSEQIKSLKDIL
jgi:DnaJ-class molecular chaperone